MRASATLAALTAALTLAGATRAQPTPAGKDAAGADEKPAGNKPAGNKPAGNKPAGNKPAGNKPAETADEKPADAEPEDGDDENGTAKKSPAESSEQAEDLPDGTDEGDERPAPVLPPPRPDEQEPRPVQVRDMPPSPARKVLLGPDIGMTLRTGSEGGVSYSAGLTMGAHVRAELWPFLGFRAYANKTWHAVDVERGALYPDTDFDQPDLTVTVIGARIEPTWVVDARLRLWAGAGVAWGRVVAPIPDGSVLLAERNGVLLEWTGAVGGSYDVVPDWLALSLSIAGGLVSNQSGQVFDSTPGIDQNGQRVLVGGLPTFEAVTSVLLGVDVIL